MARLRPPKSDAAPVPAAGRGVVRRRRLPWVLGIVGIVLAALIASEIAGWPYLRRPVERLATRLLDREVAIAPPFELHLRRTISLSLGGLRIAGPAWSTERPFVALREARAAIGWGFAIGRPLHVHALAIAEGDVFARRRADGEATWSLGKPKDGPPDEDAAGFAPPLIDRVAVGRLDLTLEDEPSELAMTARVRTAPPDRDATGPVALLAEGKGRWRGEPLAFELRTPDVLRAAGRGAADGVDLKATLKSTTVHFRGDVADLTRLDGISGEVQASGGSLGDLSVVPGLTLPATPTFRIRGGVSRKDGTVDVRVETADVGRSSLQANLQYDGNGAVPTLRGRIDARRLVLQDLGPSVGTRPSAPAGAGADAPTRAGKVLPDQSFDLPILRTMNADVAIDLKELELGTDLLRPMRSLRTHLRLSDGVLRLDDLRAGLAGGTVEGSSRFDASAGDRPPSWLVDLRWRRVDLREWIRSGEDFFVAGRFSGDTRLRGTGRSAAAILETLDGTVRGRIDGGSISHLLLEGFGLDAAQALGVAVVGSKPLALSCAMVDLKASAGTVRSNLVMLNTSDSAVFVEGGVNLAAEQLHLRLVPMPKDWSPLSLRSPITVGGSLADPKIGIEPAPIALKVLSSLVLGALSPIAALLPLVDLGTKDEGQGCAAAARQVKDRAVGLDARTGRVPGAEPLRQDAKPWTGRVPGERP